MDGFAKCRMYAVHIEVSNGEELCRIFQLGENEGFHYEGSLVEGEFCEINFGSDLMDGGFSGLKWFREVIRCDPIVCEVDSQVFC